MKRETLYTLYWMLEKLPFVNRKPKEDSEETDTDDVDIFDENDDEN